MHYQPCSAELDQHRHHYEYELGRDTRPNYKHAILSDLLLPKPVNNGDTHNQENGGTGASANSRGLVERWTLTRHTERRQENNQSW